jgi:hypothetical protein
MQCRARLNCDREIVEYTCIRDECCYIFSFLGARNSEDVTDSQVCFLHYLGRPHPDADMLRRFASIPAKKHETCVTQMAFVNAGRPCTVRTKANEDRVISAVEQELCRISPLIL